MGNKDKEGNEFYCISGDKDMYITFDMEFRKTKIHITRERREESEGKSLIVMGDREGEGSGLRFNVYGVG